MKYIKLYIKHLKMTGEEVTIAPCMHCGRTTGPKDIHHIIYRSETKKLENDVNNMILLCRGCHELFHGDKNIRNKLVKERNLCY